MEKTEESIKALFDDISPRYDLFNKACSFFLDRHWRHCSADVVEKADAKVLDLCTGTAELAVQFSYRLNGKGRVIGVDFSRKMIAQAQAKLRRLGREKDILLLLGNAERLSFQEESFDYVTSGFSMRNLIHLDQTLREMHRVLKAGGRAVILEINRPVHRFTGFFYKCYLRWAVPLIGLFTVGSLRPFLYLRDSIFSFDTPEQFCQRLGDAGFREVRFKAFAPGAIGLYVATK